MASGVVVVLGEDQGLGQFLALGNRSLLPAVAQVRAMVRIWSGVCTLRSSSSGA